MACKPVTYQNITPEMLEALRGKMNQYGFQLNDMKGNFKGMGAEVNYEYNEESKTFYLEILKKPFFVSCAKIHSVIENAISEF